MRKLLIAALLWPALALCASGEKVVTFVREMPPGADYAQHAQIAGGSTPAESYIVREFPDGATLTYIDYWAELEGYAGGGLSCTAKWTSTVATNNLRWEIAICRLTNDAVVITADCTYTFAAGNVADCTAATVAREPDYCVVTLANGADMDSWADGEAATFRVRRNSNHANDTHTGVGELHSLVCLEQ